MAMMTTRTKRKTTDAMRLSASATGIANSLRMDAARLGAAAAIGAVGVLGGEPTLCAISAILVAVASLTRYLAARRAEQSVRLYEVTKH